MRRLLRGFLLGGETLVADAADFGAGDGDLHFEVAGDLFLELLVEAGFKFADFATAEAGDMDMVARAVGFVVVAVAAEMEEVELVNEALALEEINGAIDGDEMDFGVDLLGALEDLVHVEMLFGIVHNLEDDAALAGKPDAAFAENDLEAARSIGGIEAFATRDASGRRRRGAHRRSIQESGGTAIGGGRLAIPCPGGDGKDVG